MEEEGHVKGNLGRKKREGGKEEETRTRQLEEKGGWKVGAEMEYSRL